jgi:hypothetical protein
MDQPPEFDETAAVHSPASVTTMDSDSDNKSSEADNFHRAASISSDLLYQSPQLDDHSAEPGNSRLDAQVHPEANATSSKVGEIIFIYPASKPPSTCIISLIPTEVRNKIYELLLTNPDLGHASHDPRDQYGLHPAILRTCRKFYAEASAILYGQEFFITFLCKNTYSKDSGIYHCPILRYCYYWRWDPDVHFKDASGIIKVQGWNVFVSNYNDPYKDPDAPRLAKFYKLLTSLKPNSITSFEVFTLPRGLESRHYEHYDDFKVALRPLRLLRNIQSFNIREATIIEVPHFILQHYTPSLWSHSLDPDLILELKQLASSNAPVEYATDMYPFLLGYAQAFEQYPPFTIEMDLRMGERPPYNHIWAREWKHYIRYNIRNPFKSGEHPVEEALMRAKKTSSLEDLAGFKQDRAAVVAFLEPRYQRLVLASNNTVAFIKFQKRYDCLFDTSTPDKSTPIVRDPDKYSEALVLLEQFAAAFTRDVTPEVVIRIEKMQRSFDSIYSSTAIAIKELNQSLETWEFENFKSQFIALYKTLEQQFFRTRQARKDLFKKDRCNDWECDIDLGLTWCDEEVDFTVNEPCYDVLTN